MQTILITGGAGFIGSHLIRELLDSVFKVIAIDNFNDFYNPILKRKNVASFCENENFVLYEGNIRDKDLLKKIFSDWHIDIVVHIAARAGVRPSLKNPILYEKVNCGGTLNILDTMHDYKVKNLIFASSSSIYGNNKKIPFSENDFVDRPISPYAATKKANELMCHVYHHLYDMNITCLRFFTVYGPRQRPDLAIRKFTELILQNKPICIYGNGETSRDYTYIDDIIDGIMAAINRCYPYEIINLGNSTPIRLRDLVEILESKLNTKAIKKWLPMQPGDVNCTYADISKANKLLNYNPKRKFESGISRFLNWINLEGYEYTSYK